VEAFDYKCEAFIKMTRIFEDIFDIFREMEALIINLRLFQRLRGFLKTFSKELRLFQNIPRKIEAFSINMRLFEKH
jgi:hypothetical protein